MYQKAKPQVQSSTTVAVGNAVPFCVDLDGTLVQTDTLFEAVLSLIRTRPVLCFLLPFWLLGGKAHFKTKVYRAAQLDVSDLPYRSDVLRLIGECQNSGQPIVLATAAPKEFANAVAEHMQCFSSVIATEPHRNLRGTSKAEALTEEFGSQGFDYVGNDASDLAVWRQARSATVVSSSAAFVDRVRRNTPVSRVIQDVPHSWLTYIEAMRLHQWAKNVLIFVPLIAAHRLLELTLLVDACIAFLSFGLTASAGYLFNDLLDLTADRAHPTKSSRPLASGKMPIKNGILFMATLLVSGLTLSLAVSLPFFFWMVTYLVITVSYTIWLKRHVLIDVLRFIWALYPSHPGRRGRYKHRANLLAFGVVYVLVPKLGHGETIW